MRPFRFVLVSSAQRERLSLLFASAALRRGCDSGAAEIAGARAYNGPTLVGLVAHARDDVDAVPLREQWMAIGGGLMNFLNALHLMGYGAKVLSGPSIVDEHLQAAFCHSGECLVAWILAGQPTRVPAPRAGDVARVLLSQWEA
jgi:hypothetical protein